MSAGKLYRPGGPTQGEPCEVDVGRLGLSIVGEDGVSLSLPYERLDGKVAGYDDAFVVLSGASDIGVLEVWLDRSFTAELAVYENSFSPDFRRRFAALRGSQRKGSAVRVFSRVAGVSIVLFTLWFVFGGGLATVAVAVMPIAVEEAIGEVAAEDMAADYTPCEDEELQAAVGNILSALEQQIPDNPYTFEVSVVQSDDVNAFALPGGQVFVLTGLLAQSEDPSEVAAVLGHEVQHVLGRHSLRRLVHKAGVGIVIGMLFGDSSEFIATIGAGAANLQVLGFGRDQESESDEVGLELLAKAGFDPMSPTRFWGRLAESTDDTGAAIASALSLLSTHPASVDRTDRLAELARDLPRPSKPTLSELDWASLKGRCSTE